jgi:hypothetical protein
VCKFENPLVCNYERLKLTLICHYVKSSIAIKGTVMFVVGNKQVIQQRILVLAKDRKKPRSGGRRIGAATTDDQ